MTYSLIWLPDVLQAAGLSVVTVDGWADRGRGEMGVVQGVMCHHTANHRSGDMPSLDTLILGRDNLPGPLAQLGLGRDGTYYVVAAGRCNHAGVGAFRGSAEGNNRFIGIEAEHSGRPSDPWPKAQYSAYVTGVAAILKQLRSGVEYCVAHKEFALPAGRKVDPCFDMNRFRRQVHDQLQAG